MSVPCALPGGQSTVCEGHQVDVRSMTNWSITVVKAPGKIVSTGHVTLQPLVLAAAEITPDPGTSGIFSEPCACTCSVQKRQRVNPNALRDTCRWLCWALSSRGTLPKHKPCASGSSYCSVGVGNNSLVMQLDGCCKRDCCR